MQCRKCGTSNYDTARFCQFCGASLASGDAATTEPVTPVQEKPTIRTEPFYAGFWRRFVAIIIDEVLLGAVSFFFSASYLLSVFTGPDSEAVKLTVMSNRIFSILLHWLYFTLMESSAKQATIGKMAIGIIVTDYDGRRISFLRANGRYFGKFLSAFILGIGFIMAGFTRRKQALHDMLAETLVIMK